MSVGPPPESLAPLAPALATEVDGRRLRVIRGVPYADLDGARPLELDLWLPAAPEPAPVVVFFHGGGWRLGSRRSLGPVYAGASPFARLAAAGIAVASVDYRLAGEAVWPAQRTDVATAMDWLHRRGAEAGVDPARTAVWGESAGAHLAAYAALGSPAAAAAVLWYGPADLTAGAAAQGRLDDPHTREALLLGHPVGADPTRAADASPARQVAGSPLGRTRWLLLHGEDDELVPPLHSRALQVALDEAGADVDRHLYPGTGHLWLGRPDVAADALERTTTLLEQALLP